MEEGIRALVFDAGLSAETCIIPDRNQDMKGVVNLDAEINMSMG
jgi:hypothetical protein